MFADDSGDEIHGGSKQPHGKRSLGRKLLASL